MLSAEDAEHPFQVSHRITAKVLPGLRSTQGTLLPLLHLTPASSCLHGDEIYSAKECHQGIHRDWRTEWTHTEGAQGAPGISFTIILWTSLSHRDCCRSQQMETSTHIHLIAESSTEFKRYYFLYPDRGVYSSIHLECDLFLFPPSVWWAQVSSNYTFQSNSVFFWEEPCPKKAETTGPSRNQVHMEQWGLSRISQLLKG